MTTTYVASGTIAKGIDTDINKLSTVNTGLLIRSYRYKDVIIGVTIMKDKMVDDEAFRSMEEGLSKELASSPSTLKEVSFLTVDSFISVKDSTNE